MMTSRMFFSALALIISSLLSHPAQATSETDRALKHYQEKYPGCVAVVRNQLFILPEESHIALLPALMDACISGRDIGERRMRKMHDIPKTKKPKKESGFMIRIEPPSNPNRDPMEIEY